jgi:hypothetical protein
MADFTDVEFQDFYSGHGTGDISLRNGRDVRLGDRAVVAGTTLSV